MSLFRFRKNFWRFLRQHIFIFLSIFPILVLFSACRFCVTTDILVNLFLAYSRILTYFLVWLWSLCFSFHRNILFQEAGKSFKLWGDFCSAEGHLTVWIFPGNICGNLCFCGRRHLCTWREHEVSSIPFGAAFLFLHHISWIKFFYFDFE